jgi:hypothetical protein
MREDLIKAYDIIVENQRNADSKAYIFIAVISAFLTFMNEIPLAAFTESQQAVLEYIFYLTLIPLIAFIFSLVPKYNNQFKLRIKKKNKNKLNIFYWRSMLNYIDDADFVQEYKMKYNVKDLSVADTDLLSQIHANSKILEYKKQLHNLAFIVLSQFMILILVSVCGVLVLSSNMTLTLILLLVIEIIYILRLFNINFVTFFTKNKNKV